MRMNFKDPATAVMEGIIDFHHDIQIYLIIIVTFVAWMLFSVVYEFGIMRYIREGRKEKREEENLREKFLEFLSDRRENEKERLLQGRRESLTTKSVTHGVAIELVWTILPVFVLIFIAIPSFALLYSIDEIIDPSLTIKIIGHQWYWSYEYTDYANEKMLFDSYMVPENDLQQGDTLNFESIRSWLNDLKKIPGKTPSGNTPSGNTPSGNTPVGNKSSLLIEKHVINDSNIFEGITVGDVVILVIVAGVVGYGVLIPLYTYWTTPIILPAISTVAANNVEELGKNIKKLIDNGPGSEAPTGYLGAVPEANIRAFEAVEKLLNQQKILEMVVEDNAPINVILEVALGHRDCYEALITCLCAAGHRQVSVTALAIPLSETITENFKGIMEILGNYIGF